MHKRIGSELKLTLPDASVLGDLARALAGALTALGSGAPPLPAPRPVTSEASLNRALKPNILFCCGVPCSPE